MPFDPAFPIERVRPAPYNPRAITSDAIDVLRASLRATGGLAKPILVAADGLTVAGHQRSKAVRAEGLTTVPAFVLEAPLGLDDEVRFNQLHNGTDIELGLDAVRLPPCDALGYGEVGPEDVASVGAVPGAVVRSILCDLVVRYGAWGSVVASRSGRVLSGPQYALACRQLRRPCRVYRVPDEKADEVAAYFARAYGVYDYSHLARSSWVQAMAQPDRLCGADEHNRSLLYEHHVLPALGRADRLFDLGCGHGAYVDKLARAGRAAFGVEFYRRPVGSRGRGGVGVIRFDAAAVHRMVDALCAELRARGPFDVSVADAVVNSVDSVQAERDVLVTLNALTRLGGRICLSGRRREILDQEMRRTRSVDRVRRIEFLDPSGFSAMHRKGGWFFQRFHTKADVAALAETLGPVLSHTQHASGWQVTVRKERELPVEEVEASLRREFDLPWPGGRSVGRADAIVEAWRTGCTVTPP